MVRARSFIKSAFPVAARFTGMSWVLANRYRGRGAIFALHSTSLLACHGQSARSSHNRCPFGKLALQSDKRALALYRLIWACISRNCGIG